MELKNGTPYVLAQTIDLTRDGRERLNVVLKATYAWDEHGQLSVAEVQPPPRFCDEFHGDPAASSISGEAELGPAKPGTDLLLTGFAVAPRRGTKMMDVRLALGKWKKTVRVYGDRRWKSTLGVKRPGDPEPFERIPLIWENAYGGVDDTPKKDKHLGAEPRNPVGRGVRGKRSGVDAAEELLPNLEDPEDAFDKPGKSVTPMAFGPIGRHWIPRVQYAGTYDEKWIAERMPLLPPDFDERFHHAAPAGQMTKRYLKGGEPVTMFGFGPEGKVEFDLPKLRPAVEVRMRSRTETAAMVLDTVGFDTESRTVRLLYKASVDVHGEVPDLRWTACEAAGGDGG